MSLPAARKPCGECPWRKDVKPGQFPPERFIALAGTAYDMSVRVFVCHKSVDGREFACAGYVARFEHSLALRLARIDPATVSCDVPLHETYREMAIANGVPPDHPALRLCR